MLERAAPRSMRPSPTLLRRSKASLISTIATFRTRQNEDKFLFACASDQPSISL